jgi:hypothetical protein
VHPGRIRFTLTHELGHYMLHRQSTGLDGFERDSGDMPAMIPTQPVDPATRPGTKHARMIELMRRPEGASIEEIAAETGWLAHTVHGTMNNALKKRMGLTLTSEKTNGEPRRYRIADGDDS